MSRLEKKSIKAHLNQDIKPPFAVLRLPKSSSDLCPQMVMWQMIFPEDIQNTEAHSAPTQETAVWKQLWGPFCEVWAAPTHTNGRVEREMPRKSKGLFGEVLSIDCPIIFALTTQHRTACLRDQTYRPDITREDFPGVQVFSQIEDI